MATTTNQSFEEEDLTSSQELVRISIIDVYFNDLLTSVIQNVNKINLLSLWWSLDKLNISRSDILDLVEFYRLCA